MERGEHIINTVVYSEKFLSQNIEKILFQESDFAKIKSSFNNLMLGSIEPKIFKEMLVELRFKMLKELVEFFPFYTEYRNNVRGLDDFTESSSSNMAEVQKRDELLTEVGIRLNSIYEQLKKNKVGILSNKLSKILKSSVSLSEK